MKYCKKSFIGLIVGLVVVIFLTTIDTQAGNNSSYSFEPYSESNTNDDKKYNDVQMEDVLDQWGQYQNDPAPEAEVIRIIHNDGTSIGLTPSERFKDLNHSATNFFLNWSEQ